MSSQSISMTLLLLYLMVIVAPLLCMMLVVSVDVLDVADVLPIVLDVDLTHLAT